MSRELVDFLYNEKEDELARQIGLVKRSRSFLPSFDGVAINVVLDANECTIGKQSVLEHVPIVFGGWDGGLCGLTMRKRTVERLFLGLSSFHPFSTNHHPTPVGILYPLPLFHPAIDSRFQQSLRIVVFCPPQLPHPL
jgi:hypothetical protein